MDIFHPHPAPRVGSSVTSSLRTPNPHSEFWEFLLHSCHPKMNVFHTCFNLNTKWKKRQLLRSDCCVNKSFAHTTRAIDPISSIISYRSEFVKWFLRCIRNPRITVIANPDIIKLQTDRETPGALWTIIPRLGSSAAADKNLSLSGLKRPGSKA